VELSKLPGLALLCGHYEGVDERVLEALVDEEISIGDYVLTGGELPALVLCDCIARLLPGVLKADAAYIGESHWSGLLEHPQYTRPAMWEGRAVPEVLLNGNHALQEQWRREQMLARTRRKRPDLLSFEESKQ
jgi:tRNA (guanine37-N1)-methyltransferase